MIPITQARIFFVIPAFNEGEAIGPVVAGVRTKFDHVIVVDDGSSDQTGQFACAAGAIVLRHLVNLGQGAALQTGIQYALMQKADYIVTFDADGQHRVADVETMLASLIEQGADLALGSRFLGSAIGMTAAKWLTLKLAILFTFLTTGMLLTDAHNGLRVLTASAAQRIRIRQNRMAHASEIISEIGRLKLNYIECPVVIEYTEYSMRKGQRISGALSIVSELFIAGLQK